MSGINKGFFNSGFNLISKQRSSLSAFGMTGAQRPPKVESPRINNQKRHYFPNPPAVEKNISNENNCNFKIGWQHSPQFRF